MDLIPYLRIEIQFAHQYLEMVMAGVTPEQAQWIPPGIANPLGAIYAHAILEEDSWIHTFIKGSPPLYESSWEGKTGISDPQYFITLGWARSLKVDLEALRRYAQAVYKAAEDSLATLTESDLNRQVDLSIQGLGQKPLSWVFAALIVSHINNMIGEISCLKGIQGSKGYPY
jgi:hypothetical protein